MMDTEMEVQDDMQWFRWYNGTRHKRTYRALSPEGRCLWAALLEMSSELGLKGVVHAAPGLPLTDKELADEANITVEAVKPALDRLRLGGWIEMRPDCIFVVNFAERQYMSDTSTERVKAYRQRRKKQDGNGDETFPKHPSNVEVTPPDNRVQSTDTDKKSNVRSSKGAVEYTPEFENFWSIYPRRLAKKDAFKAWSARLKEGVTEAELILCASNYAAATIGQEERFIKHPTTFLREERWRDYLGKKGPAKVVRMAPKEDDVTRMLRELEEAKRSGREIQ